MFGFWRKVQCEDPSQPETQQFQLQNWFSQQSDLMGLGQPLSLGLVSGFSSGYFLKKVGKVAVVSSGVVFLLFQAAAQKEYLTINWTKVDRDFNTFISSYKQTSPDVLADPATRASVALADFARLCTEKTGITSGAFMAGLILGLKKG